MLISVGNPQGQTLQKDFDGMEIDLNAYDDSHVLDGKLYTGLFPFNEGIIMDVNFGGVKFTNFDNNSSEKYKEIICGAICGRNDGKITRCFISGYNIPLTVDCDEFVFGSIVGINCGEMRLCTMPQNINISGKAKLIIAGGLSGKSNGGFFDKCSRKGWILTNNLECNLTTIGCLCGESEKSRFENCCVYNGYDDNVGLNEDANSTFVLGGFVGKISGECTIIDSYSNVTIAVRNSPSTKAGFLFGCADGNAAIKNVVVNGRINIYSDGSNLIGDAGIFDSEMGFSSKNSYRVKTASFFPTASEEYLKLIEIDSKVLNLNMLGWDSNIWNIQDGVISFVV